MKKTLTILLTLILCLSVLFGCDAEKNEECGHNWVLVSSSEEKYECAECKETHLCGNPENFEKAGRLNESTLIYKCKICGSEHLTTDPDSINPDSGINDHIPYDSELNLEFVDGKLMFQRIATTPCIVYSNAPIIDMAEGTVYDNRHDILTAIFRATDGKDAILDTYECVFSHHIYMFDNENENASWHYRFAICDCGAVTITNNNELVCSIKISEEEIQTILNAFSTDSTNNPSECESPDEHDWQSVSQDNGCWYSIITYACSKCDMEQTAEADLALPNHIWEESTVDGKTTFRCTRCNDSHTIMSEIRKFSYAQALEEYKIGDPGVKHENFNNPAIEIEIESAIDAITRAEFELTIEYDTISVAYDETTGMWRVDFWTLDLDGNGQSVYIDGDGLTCYIVYGE